MLSDKEIKKKFLEITAKEPDKFYPTKALKEKGFKRQQCEKCGRYFWSIINRKTCGDSICTGGFSFIGNTPAKNKLDYIGVWKEFSKIMKKYGYKEIKRYPVVARWNPTTEFTIASIAAFQPYVVSGDIEPPAEKLVIPQFCLRFNDIDNVGITGAHYTGFIMMGQHAFVPPEKYNINDYFKHIYEWLTQGIGIPPEEIQFHEDFWAGGGNFGPSMEFFSRGVEIGNQVYMQYEQVSEKIDSRGYRELSLKVLDMGEGQERAAWFSQGALTSYETTFPTVIKKIKDKINFKLTNEDEEILKKYVPYSALMNIDDIDEELLKSETNYIEMLLEKISKEIKVDKERLKKIILPLSAIYSIAEHSRALLFAISDGQLPSNSGGGYNLRNIFRRAQSLIEKNNWDININELIEEHANYLEPLFSELKENLDEVKEIINHELKKYKENKQQAKRIIERIIKNNEKITKEKLIQLYDSDGIDPYFLKKELEKENIKIEVPNNFYALISKLHEEKKTKEETQKEKNTQTKQEIDIDLTGLPNTEILYYQDYTLTKFKANIIKNFGDKIILDKTAFYPTSGGQLHDIGNIDGVKVIKVRKHEGKIIHYLEKEVDWKEAKEITGKIDFNRRLQLAQHHTATHVLNGVCRKLLGSHIWQYGASKTPEKARLDITHYEKINDEMLQKIENEANNIINQNIPVISKIMKKNLAELEYGMRIYQGGAVPGKELRIIEIPKLDVEACGGTHVKETSEIGTIKILKSTKLQDGVIRIEFVAGEAARKEVEKYYEIIWDLINIFKIPEKLNGKEQEEKIKERIKEVFTLWKKIRKATKKKKSPEEIEELKKQLYEKVNKNYEPENNQLEKKLEEIKIQEPKKLIEEISQEINSQPAHLINTIKKFLSV